MGSVRGIRRFLVGAFLIVIVSTGSAGAEEARSIGTFRDWSAYAYGEPKGKVCFAASKPVKSLPAGARRGEIYVQVTHRPGEGSRNVFSVINGYTFKPDSSATLTIGKQTFSLLTQGDSAWGRDEAADKAIASALKSGSSMTVEGVSSRGTKTTDTYALAGSGAALQAIDRACAGR